MRIPLCYCFIPNYLFKIEVCFHNYHRMVRISVCTWVCHRFFYLVSISFFTSMKSIWYLWLSPGDFQVYLLLRWVLYHVLVIMYWFCLQNPGGNYFGLQDHIYQLFLFLHFSNYCIPISQYDYIISCFCLFQLLF